MGDDRRDEHDDCCCGGFRRDRRRRGRRGDTISFSLTVLQNAQTGEYGTAWPGEPFPPLCAPVNLTGWRVVFTAKYELPDFDSQAVSQLDNQALGGVVLTAATLGQLSVSIPFGATVGFPDGPVRLVYDVEGIDASGGVHTAEMGRLTIEPDVTRLT